MHVAAMGAADPADRATARPVGPPPAKRGRRELEGRMKEERDWLPTLIQWFQDAEDATVDAREKSERDRDYYDNKQFTAEEFEALRKRGQPAISHNLIRQKIDYLLGLEKQTRSDPKAYPRNPDDEQAADAAAQDGLDLLLGLAFSLGGWFARVLWVAVRDLEKDLARLREDLPRVYLPKSEAHEAINDLAHEMRGNFRRLFEMLDRKVDK